MAYSDQLLVGEPSPEEITPARARAYMLSQQGRVLTENDIHAFVESIRNACVRYGVKFSPRFVQAMVETNNGRYGGQVKVEQKNIGGIGATDDGAAGMSNPDWATAGMVFVAHSLAWAGDPRGKDSPRYALVAQKAKRTGYARTFRELGGGRWATDAHYGEAIDKRYADIARGTMATRVAISAGHHNTSGGDRFEHAQTGELAEALARWCAHYGLEPRVVQPDGPDPDTERGDGDVAGSLDLVGKIVVGWRDQGWVPDYFIECHTEGGGGVGVFCIYPDWTGDVDTDVRDKLGPDIARRVSNATGLAVRNVNGPGVMSERRTGVGIGGSRLGIFRTTEPLKATTTRLIVEYGAHDKQPDLTIAQRPDFAELCGKATAEALAMHAGMTDLTPARPVTYDDVTGFYVAEEIYPSYNALGGWGFVGRPIAPAAMYSDGKLRQPFENMVLSYDPVRQMVRVEGAIAAFAVQAGSPYPTWGDIVPHI